MVDCGSQLRRAGMAGAAVGLDFGAVMAVGTARSVDLPLLSTVLPHCEAAILNGQDGNVDVEGDDG